MMKNVDMMQKVLTYIDDNIDANLEVKVLCDVASFSPAHFLRLFVGYMNISPARYVLRRKLYYAAKDLVSNNQRITDIAFHYGFESLEVFSRAFRRYYGVLPDAFRKNGVNLDQFYLENAYCISDYAIPITLQNQNKERCNMEQEQEHEVKIVTLPEMKLIGVERVIGEERAFDVFYNNYDKIFRNAPNRKYPLVEARIWYIGKSDTSYAKSALTDKLRI